jgi:phosphatidylserine/phosphatidylglycerophosphate/cardiolipin synthase-like enzyme
MGKHRAMSALLTPGQTCWRVAHADQFARLIDAADYFKHVKAAMLRAQHRIMLIGWDFDTRMRFERGVKTFDDAPRSRRSRT